MPQDPKFRFGADDRIIHRQDGSVVPDDEPVMLLRGKDEVALRAIAYYVQIMESYPDSSLARDHAATARERLDTIKTWQKMNPDRTGMGCHSCADHSHREHLPELPEI